MTVASENHEGFISQYQKNTLFKNHTKLKPDPYFQIPHYHNLTVRSAKACEEHFNRLRDIVEDQHDPECTHAGFLQYQQAQLTSELIQIGLDVISDIDEEISNSATLNNCLYDFGCQLFMSVTLLEAFNCLFFKINSPICFEIIKWFHKFAKTGSEKQSLIEINNETLNSRIATEILTFNKSEALKYITYLKIRNELSNDVIDNLIRLIERCPFDLNDDKICENFEKLYSDWKKECEIVYACPELNSKFELITISLQICSGRIELFEEIEDDIFTKDSYKLFLLEQIHRNPLCLREDFVKNAKEYFFGEFDQFHIYEKAIVELFRGNILSFLIYSTQEVRFWWMPMHIVHLHFIYNSESSKNIEIFESIITKHLESILSMDPSFWKIAIMYVKELVTNYDGILENILLNANVDNYEDFHYLLSEAETIELNSEKLYLNFAKHLIDTEKYHDAFFLYNDDAIQSKVVFYLYLTRRILKSFDESNKIKPSLPEISIYPPENCNVIDLNYLIQIYDFLNEKKIPEAVNAILSLDVSLNYNLTTNFFKYCFRKITNFSQYKLNKSELTALRKFLVTTIFDIDVLQEIFSYF